MADDTDIRLAMNDGVAALTSVPPAAMNALTLDMAAALQDAVARIAADPAIRTRLSRSACTGLHRRVKGRP